MLTLGNIRPTPDEARGFPYFCTITLPKCHYRKSALKQCEVMDNLLKRIGENFFAEAYGSYELTMKGNVHAHLICKLRDGIQLKSNEASVKMMSSLLKSYSNCDFQIIRNMENILTYIYKDIQETHDILKGERNPIISLTPKKYNLKRIQCAHNVPIDEECKRCGDSIRITRYNDRIYTLRDSGSIPSHMKCSYTDMLDDLRSDVSDSE